MSGTYHELTPAQALRMLEAGAPIWYWSSPDFCYRRVTAAARAPRSGLRRRVGQWSLFSKSANGPESENTRPDNSG